MSEFKAKLDMCWLSKIADFIEETAKAMGCKDSNIIYDLKLAVDEASTNIMTHGKKSQRKDYFMIHMTKVGKEIEVEITDFGKSYPFDQVKLPLENLPLEEKLKNGFGIGLIKSVTEKAEYKSFPDKNVLRFYKYF